MGTEGREGQEEGEEEFIWDRTEEGRAGISVFMYWRCECLVSLIRLFQLPLRLPCSSGI